MKQFILSLILAAAVVLAPSCLKIETAREKDLALCLPVGDMNTTVLDTADPHVFEVAAWSETEMPVLLCYTNGAGVTATRNELYRPDVAERWDRRHYEYQIRIPQPGGDIYFVFNWPDTYR